MPIDFSPEGSDDTTPLSLSEAANAYAGTIEAEEPDEGQPEAESGPEGENEADEDELPSDEEGEDEVEGETEDEGQADDEDESAESDQGRFVSPNGKVRLPDGSIVPVSELINGNLRDRDYRQKTMEVAETRKAFETQSEAVKQRETQLEEQRQYVVALVKSIIPSPPDNSMADMSSPNYDPAGYISAKAQYENWTQHLNYLDSEQQRTVQERQAKTETETKEKVQKEWAAALEKLPELKDPKRLERFGQDVLKFGADYGYTPQELANVHHDHRQLLVLKKAIAFDKIQANKTKVAAKIEGRPPVQRGGTRLDPTRTQARETRVAMDRLNQSGSLKDGITALLATEKG